MPAAATLIAIRNAEEHRKQLAAEEAHRTRGDDATSHVPAVAQDLASLQRQVDNLQARVQAYEVTKPKHPYIELDDAFRFYGIAVFVIVAICLVVAVSYPLEAWWKKREVQRGS